MEDQKEIFSSTLGDGWKDFQEHFEDPFEAFQFLVDVMDKGVNVEAKEQIEAMAKKVKDNETDNFRKEQQGMLRRAYEVYAQYHVPPTIIKSAAAPPLLLHKIDWWYERWQAETGDLIAAREGNLRGGAANVVEAGIGAYNKGFKGVIEGGLEAMEARYPRMTSSEYPKSKYSWGMFRKTMMGSANVYEKAKEAITRWMNGAEAVLTNPFDEMMANGTDQKTIMELHRQFTVEHTAEGYRQFLREHPDADLDRTIIEHGEAAPSRGFFPKVWNDIRSIAEGERDIAGYRSAYAPLFDKAFAEVHGPYYRIGDLLENSWTEMTSEQMRTELDAYANQRVEQMARNVELYKNNPAMNPDRTGFNTEVWERAISDQAALEAARPGLAPWSRSPKFTEALRSFTRAGPNAKFGMQVAGASIGVAYAAWLGSGHDKIADLDKAMSALGYYQLGELGFGLAGAYFGGTTVGSVMGSTFALPVVGTFANPMADWTLLPSYTPDAIGRYALGMEGEGAGAGAAAAGEGVADATVGEMAGMGFSEAAGEGALVAGAGAATASGGAAAAAFLLEAFVPLTILAATGLGAMEVAQAINDQGHLANHKRNYEAVDYGANETANNFADAMRDSWLDVFDDLNKQHNDDARTEAVVDGMATGTSGDHYGSDADLQNWNPYSVHDNKDMWDHDHKQELHEQFRTNYQTMYMSMMQGLTSPGNGGPGVPIPQAYYDLDEEGGHARNSTWGDDEDIYSWNGGEIYEQDIYTMINNCAREVKEISAECMQMQNMYVRQSDNPLLASMYIHMDPNGWYAQEDVRSFSDEWYSSDEVRVDGYMGREAMDITAKTQLMRDSNGNVVEADLAIPRVQTSSLRTLGIFATEDEANLPTEDTVSMQEAQFFVARERYRLSQLEGGQAAVDGEIQYMHDVMQYRQYLEQQEAIYADYEQSLEDHGANGPLAAQGVDRHLSSQVEDVLEESAYGSDYDALEVEIDAFMQFVAQDDHLKAYGDSIDDVGYSPETYFDMVEQSDHFTEEQLATMIRHYEHSGSEENPDAWLQTTFHDQMLAKEEREEKEAGKKEGQLLKDKFKDGTKDQTGKDAEDKGDDDNEDAGESGRYVYTDDGMVFVPDSTGLNSQHGTLWSSYQYDDDEIIHMIESDPHFFETYGIEDTRQSHRASQQGDDATDADNPSDPSFSGQIEDYDGPDAPSKDDGGHQFPPQANSNYMDLDHPSNNDYYQPSGRSGQKRQKVIGSGGAHGASGQGTSHAQPTISKADVLRGVIMQLAAAKYKTMGSRSYTRG